MASYHVHLDFVLLLDIPGLPVTTLRLTVVCKAQTRLKVVWSGGADFYFGFCHEYLWEDVLIFDSFCLLVSGEPIRDKGMWKRFRIWNFRGPCTMRLDILCGSIWTSPQTVLKMWGLKLAGIHRTLWMDSEQSRGLEHHCAGSGLRKAASDLLMLCLHQ